ncbi:ABC transporter permease [Corynebacterium felinum]|uniref:Ribose transport system permease protein n=1 Tax=Corynebacterium felinum TaxID=131318 RepID=A0ABU2B7Q2_9CORY|nr:ABC transporter permease [Corynebacterium felinum]MDF5821599.1 ABC transporter permease [Corynebacterium felinum]MDR7354647.1 ribose transport system permease protein [Corynebacterium felinum]WJY94012.1 Ribose transport system permease protein RbsC [Corynebacterium felinum]
MSKTGTQLATRMGAQLQQLLALAALAAIFLFFSFSTDNFFQWNNITNILLSSAVIGTMALGATFVIATAGIDLSVGTGMTLCAVMTGVFLSGDWLGLPLPVGILLSIAFGAFMGFINGINVAIFKIPPFIATLAMMMVAQGLALIITKSTPIYLNGVNGFSGISQGQLISDFPNAALVFIICALFAAVVMSKTLLGRYALSIGSNEEATRISGVNTRRWLVAIYTFAGIFTALAAILLSARLNSAQPATGMGYELEAIAAVVIGGTSLSGGRATIFGTFIGALLMAVLANGLQIMSIPQEWQKVSIGIVILIAVFADNLRRSREKKV